MLVQRRFQQAIITLWVGTILAAIAGIIAAFWWAPPVQAVSSSGGLNVTATVLPTVPTTPAIINNPLDNTQLQTTPLVVSGTCGAGLTVRIFNNTQLAGTSSCATDGTFNINITLDYGKNVLTALNYDSFDQAGPASDSVTVWVDTPPNPTNNTAEDGQDGQINDALGSAATDTSQTSLLDSSDRLFEGTFIEPIAKALDVGATVSPGTSRAIAIATNATFVLCVIALVAIFLF